MINRKIQARIILDILSWIAPILIAALVNINEEEDQRRAAPNALNSPIKPVIDYYNILLSDELFDGKNVRLKLYSEYSDYDTELYIYFRSVSRTYYQYKKKLLRHIENQYSNIWSGTGNPVTLFSNIENGYGIFAGYCEQVDTIKIAEWKK